MITVTRTHAARLVDVSTTGARLRDEDLPAVDEVLELTVGNVRAFAIVRWVSNGECGIAFEPPLTEPEVTSLRHQVMLARGLSLETRGAYDDWTQGLAR